MKTIAIVGAGPGLGLSIAKRFGKQQFKVALIARNADKLAAIIQELNNMDNQAKFYLADISQLTQLKRALGEVKSDFGGIDVLEFSPSAGLETYKHILETTPQSVLEYVNGYLLPAIQCVNEVLPEMQQKGEGSILFSSGVSAQYPLPFLGNGSAVMAALRNYASNLHETLKVNGVYVGFLAIGTLIKPGTEGDPDLIAEAWYELYRNKDKFEETFPKDFKPVQEL
ncbi:SDR family NAD(P)-dependent oxidoreductase [Paenibacillus sp. FSL R7-0048]|uniref:SDR family NAD(P)-dependent oxidoreductase n=1 Tax=Paenibacillus TaxID=44249 RepID=UPI00096E2002|nr:SDR family NAD(P)-dependent oxidoreductase [Paenibacillus odorifer]OMD70162.1 short-chain dehydrogenase [Paenibacillus odorifer]OMD83626.1 short-chain dehydrogenase [Paenibacillus odorifer]